jgi:hypothetical protein
MRIAACSLLQICILCGVAQAQENYAVDRYQLWKSVGLISEFQLSEAQIRNIDDAIHRFNAGTESYDAKVENSENRILKAMQDELMNQTEIMKQISSITAMRIAREKERLLIAYEMRKYFTQDQWAKFLKGPGVLNYPRRIHDFRAPYPHFRGVDGVLTMEIIIKKDGKLAVLRVLKGISPDLDKEIIKKVETEGQYQPATLNGQVIDYQTKRDFYFINGEYSVFPN